MRYRLLKELPREVALEFIRVAAFENGHSNYYAFYWANDIGDRDITREICGWWEEYWAKDIGDIVYMRRLVIKQRDVYIIDDWNHIYKGSKYEIPTFERTS